MLFPIASFQVTDESRAMAQDVRSALRRADVDLTAMALSIQTPLPRLSNQINGHEPFTLLWRVLAVMGAEAWGHFLAIRTARIGLELVPKDVGQLIRDVQALVGRRPMARADLQQPEQKASGL